jgi:uncharacterized membrane protein YdjX (TVP38/TMEM64 family)
VQADEGTASPRPGAPRRAVALVAAIAAILVVAGFASRGLAGPGAVAAAMMQAQALVVAHPIPAALGFALFYTAVAALGVPAIWAMNVAAGALFGPWVGLPIAVAASVTGATITMLAARYAFRGWVEARFPAAVAHIDHGVTNGGARFLFAARLMPLLPFPLVNLAAGLTPMPARIFALVSLTGVLPLSFAYVSAGARLASVRSPAEAVSPGLVAVLIALAAAPFAARALLSRLGAVLRVNRRPNRPS